MKFIWIKIVLDQRLKFVLKNTIYESWQKNLRISLTLAKSIIVYVGFTNTHGNGLKKTKEMSSILIFKNCQKTLNILRKMALTRSPTFAHVCFMIEKNYENGINFCDTKRIVSMCKNLTPP